MGTGAGQSAAMSALTAAIGVFILHAGAEAVLAQPVVSHLGEGDVGSTKWQGAVIIGLGIALIAAASKLAVVALTDAFFTKGMTPEEVWDEMSVSLQSRIHFAVTEGYSRVVVKDKDLHEMMRFMPQKHVRFINKKNGVVEISRAMNRFVQEVPDDEIRAFRATPIIVPQQLPDSFWSPQPTVAMPAQNY